MRPSPSTDRAFFGHPRGLSTLFFSEMWERFSYYGMRGFLILYMTAAASTGGMGLDTATAAAVYGTYTSLVYLMSLPGGWVADRLIGQRRAVLVGGILIASGHFSLAFPAAATFYLGLLLIVLGTGLLKPNISVIVGQLYAPDDTRRDAGFSLFYMGINLGAFIGPLITGLLAQSDWFRTKLIGWGLDPNTAWHWAFGAAGVGMTLGLIQYVLGGRNLGEAGLAPATPPTPANKRRAAVLARQRPPRARRARRPHVQRLCPRSTRPSSPYAYSLLPAWQSRLAFFVLAGFSAGTGTPGRKT